MTPIQVELIVSTAFLPIVRCTPLVVRKTSTPFFTRPPRPALIGMDLTSLPSLRTFMTCFLVSTIETFAAPTSNLRVTSLAPSLPGISLSFAVRVTYWCGLQYVFVR